MAEHMKTLAPTAGFWQGVKPDFSRLAPGFIAIMCGFCAFQAQAESLGDPTQPPGADAQTGTVDGMPGAPQLQSIMMGPGGKSAMISGQIVPLGGKLGDATLVKITDNSAVLRDEDGELQTLEMHPAVTKTMKPEPKPGKQGAKPRKANDAK